MATSDEDALAAALLAAAQMLSGGSKTTKAPIGVPDDYRVGPTIHLPGQNAGTSVDFSKPPQYNEGDEYRPAGWSPAQIADLQDKMIAAGLIPKTAKIRRGVFDDTTRDAYTDLLGLANRSGRTATTELEGLMANPPTDLGGAEGRALVKRVPNEADVAARVKAVAQSVLGGGADPKTVARIVQAFQQASLAEQEDAFAVAEGGGTISDGPSIEAFAEQQLRDLEPDESLRQAGRTVMSDFLSAIGADRGLD